MKNYPEPLSDRLRNFLHLLRKDYNKDADKLRPEVFLGDYSLLNQVSTHEASVSTANSPRPVLETVGMGPCVAMAGYDAEQRIGFLSHSCIGDDVDAHDLVLEEMKKLTSKELCMQVYIVGGMVGSGKLASRLRNYARQKLNPTTIQEDLALKVSDWTYSGKSFVLDTRDGKVYSIDGRGKLQYVLSANPRISLRASAQDGGSRFS